MTVSTTQALHAASREALAAGERRLAELTRSVNPAALGTLGDELFAVVGLLTEQSALRRLLADPSSDPASRVDLLTRLLTGKVSTTTQTLLGEVVGFRWSNPRELVDGVEALARTALLVQAERGDRLDAVEDELFRLSRIVLAQPRLDQVLSDPVGSTEGRVSVIRELLTGKVEPVTAALVEQLVARPRGRAIVAGLEDLVALAARRRESSVAYVRSAIALTAAQLDTLSATLRRLYDRQIALHIEVDPALTGGLVIKIGDEVIDGSVAGRLAALRRELS
jgi:F-type H+-transporting ATPase subunit delta